VAPAHYGYKNVKHLRSIEFWRDARAYRLAGPRFLDHPSARVALERHQRRRAAAPSPTPEPPARDRR
jgi:hypothetical protein